MRVKTILTDNDISEVNYIIGRWYDEITMAGFYTCSLSFAFSHDFNIHKKLAVCAALSKNGFIIKFSKPKDSSGLYDAQFYLSDKEFTPPNKTGHDFVPLEEVLHAFD